MVKCVDCGFLTIQDVAAPPRGDSVLSEPAFLEASRAQRENASSWERTAFTCYVDEPQFSRDAAELHDEFPNNPEQNDPNSITWKLIHRERRCGSYRDWVIGFGPKDHAMLRNQERLERREDARDEAQRKWQRDESHFNKWTRIAELAIIMTAAVAAFAAVIVSVL